MPRRPASSPNWPRPARTTCPRSRKSCWKSSRTDRLAPQRSQCRSTLAAAGPPTFLFFDSTHHVPHPATDRAADQPALRHSRRRRLISWRQPALRLFCFLIPPTMSRTLQLTEQLISLPSVTPEDAGCLELLADALQP